MRIENEPAYVLEARPYRETSLLLELLTREHGRLAVVARGVRAPGRRQGARRAVLEPFRRLRIGVSGRGEVVTLTAVEAEGAPVRPVGAALFSALYVNELVLRLTGRGDPVAAVFERYAGWLDELVMAWPISPAPLAVAEPGAAVDASGTMLAWALRRFERDLLAVLGYALALDHDSDSGDPLRPDHDYALDPDHGARRWSPDSPWPRVSGATLLAWAGDQPPDPSQSLALKRVARTVLRHHLGGAELRAWRLAAQWRLGPAD